MGSIALRTSEIVIGFCRGYRLETFPRTKTYHIYNTIYIIPDVILKHLGCIYCILRINVDIGIHEPKIILKVTRCKGTMSDFLESSSTPSDRWGMLHLEPLNLFDMFFIIYCFRRISLEPIWVYRNIRKTTTSGIWSQNTWYITCSLRVSKLYA